MGCFCPIIEVVLKNNIIPFVEVEIAYIAFYINATTIIQLKIQNYFNDIMAYLELDHHQFPEISTLYNLTVSVAISSEHPVQI